MLWNLLNGCCGKEGLGRTPGWDTAEFGGGAKDQRGEGVNPPLMWRFYEILICLASRLHFVNEKSTRGSPTFHDQQYVKIHGKAPRPTSRENWLTEIAPWEKSRTASEEWLRKCSKNDVNPHDIFRWHFLTMYGMASHVCTTTGSFGRGRSSKAPGGAAWAWIGGQKLEPVF